MASRNQVGTAPGDYLKVLLSLVAIIVAAVAIYVVWKRQQPYEVGRINLPPGSNPKVQAMKAMKQGQEPQQGTDPNSLGDAGGVVHGSAAGDANGPR